MRRPVLLDAPSNLGLHPPSAGAEPGCHLLPAALRQQGLLTRLGATDGGAVPPPPYTDHSWRPGDGVRHARQIAGYTRQLADRVTSILAQDGFPILLGGDCSILLGPMLALRRRGRSALVCVDGPDFRHPGNAAHVGGAAGESLALVTGRGEAGLTNLDGLAPYVRDEDAVVIGMRDDDEYRAEVERTFTTVRASQIVAAGGLPAAAGILTRLEAAELAGFWLHVDADVLDPSVMPAVDTPEPGGIDHPQLGEVLRVLLASPACVGLDLTIYDPSRDPDRTAAAALVDTLVAALS